MNRTTKSKLQYILILMIISTFVSVLIVGLYKENLIILIPIVPIIFLIPGRVQGYYYRDFFKARRLLGQKNYQSSIEFIYDENKKTVKKDKNLFYCFFFIRYNEALYIKTLLNSVSFTHLKLI